MIPNLRDIGGRVTSDGRRVTRGAVYRSAMFACEPDSPAISTLEDLGVRRVLDLRSPDELGEGGAPNLPGFVLRIWPPSLPSIENRRFQPVPGDPEQTAQRYYEYLLEGRLAVAGALDSLSVARSKP